MPTVTPLYAALLAILFIVLSARVILRRREESISVGDAGDRELIKRMRIQSNCAEYAPMGLLLLLMAELMGTAPLLLHLLGLMLLAGRVAHGYGMSRKPQIVALRVYGMVLTLTMLALTAFVLIWQLVF